MKPLALVRAMRPHQWVKNVFVLAALLFSMGESHDLASKSDLLRNVVQAFFSFCLGASAIYLVNDVMDVERDRTHPTKRLRPIAAGELPIPVALVTSAGCVVGALCMGYFASTSHGSVAAVVGGYMLMNFAYSWKLKHVVIVDAFCIATGFILRVIAGGIAAEAPISQWLLLCTLFLALFLALAKRHAEMGLLGDKGGDHRGILREYTEEFLDQTLVVLAACAIMTYTMYTVAEETKEKFGEDNNLVLTVPFVVFGLFRYMLLVQTRVGGGNPTKVLLGGDLPFVINAVSWLATVVILLFFQGALS